MIFNKKLINDLLLCNPLDDKDVCKYGSIVLKHLTMLNGNKITYVNQCPIFFSSDNNKVHLHPYSPSNVHWDK